MATKQTSGSTQRKRSTANGSGAKPRKSGTSSGAASRSRATRASGSGTTRKTTSRPARATGSGSGQRTRPANRAPERATTASQNGSGVLGSIKDVVSKAKGPAVAVGATAVGVAGGLVLKNRTQRKTVLGVKVPRKPNIDIDIDIASIAKSVGKASEQFGKTSKTLSKDMERVGDSAERIGKLLG